MRISFRSISHQLHASNHLKLKSSCSGSINYAHIFIAGFIESQAKCLRFMEASLGLCSSKPHDFSGHFMSSVEFSFGFAMNAFDFQAQPAYL
jgi:hypothetical protein